MNRSKSITLKLKKTDVEIKNYVLELEKENAKLQKTIAKFEAKSVSNQHRISALKKFQPGPVEIEIVPPKEINEERENTKK